MARLRSDLGFTVILQGITLHPGDEIPEGITVADRLTERGAERGAAAETEDKPERKPEQKRRAAK